MTDLGKPSRRAVPNGWLAIGLLAFGLASAELALQIRSQIKTGTSLLNPLRQVSTYIVDPATGLSVYRPNSVIGGTDIRIRTNRYGLRSPDIPARPLPNELRIAVIGASTVAGVYTPTNEQTFSQRLAVRLRAHYPDRPVNVIDAGIPGYWLHDMHRMLDVRVVNLRPRLIILYAGSNDIAGLCQVRSRVRPNTRIALPYPALEKALLLRDITKKNTIAIRTSHLLSPSGPAKPDTFDAAYLASYREELRAMFRTARQRGIDMIMVTSVKAYRKEMPLIQQEQVARTALSYYDDCFSLDGIYRAERSLTGVQREVAAEYGQRFVDISKLVPGGRRHFLDSTHLTPLGEQAVAKAIYPHLLAALGPN
ncbi:SGNH/GDSL hydrolase family protein [Sphingomonas sp. Root720]|uniref:SGNH/GDSL hydrolase family protein n=1 Tax=Sphingomonas sp. Root720 TaxID=1736595 RepID=UPI0007148636|nr:SGNH/GDSL hydrolase family protein [Sphingomonas sp. Root720]KRB90921.1 hypothetical protein ASE22_11615 [Sphingomonas sp. Root720]